MKYYVSFLIVVFCISCQQKKKSEKKNEDYTEVEINYAQGFSIQQFSNYTKVLVHSPWQNAKKDLVYLLKNKDVEISEQVTYDALIELPIQKLVTTSTTHIPSLITLNKIEKLVGFPNLDYISSEEARTLINTGKVKELGQNEALNTEVLLAVEPDVVFSFSVEGQNKALNQIQNSGIPVVYNGDWLENDVLGKAEWIKFFGAFLGELERSEEAFEAVESNYISYKQLVKDINKQPSVISGAMYQDRWYLPYGTSWQAQLFEDANATYIYKDTEGKGSAAYSFEKVLNDAKDAEFWISPAQFTSYSQLIENNPHYKEFIAFQEKNIYTAATTTGEKGGVLFYELGPNRPDLILKDLIKIVHPEVMQDKAFSFFKPLKN